MFQYGLQHVSKQSAACSHTGCTILQNRVQPALIWSAACLNAECTMHVGRCQVDILGRGRVHSTVVHRVVRLPDVILTVADIALDAKQAAGRCADR